MKEHGYFEIDLQGRVLMVRLFDLWNVETVQHLMDDIMRHAADLRDSPWATLMDLRLWSFAAPESLRPFRVHTRELDQMNRTHVAIVNHEDDLRRAMVNDFMRDMRAQYRFFANEEDARAWLFAAGIE